MPTNVVMPQMGESIAEGTIVRWIKKVGDAVDRDEPLFEISTDKVDAEIPAPAAGVLTAIRVKEGETVPGQQRGGGDWRGGARPTAAATEPRRHRAAPRPPRVSPRPRRPPRVTTPQPAPRPATARKRTDDQRRTDLRRQKSSPLVRRIAKEHNVDIKLIKGTGISGRVTKQDILGFIESGGRPRRRRRRPRVSQRPLPAYARRARA